MSILNIKGDLSKYKGPPIKVNLSSFIAPWCSDDHKSHGAETIESLQHDWYFTKKSSKLSDSKFTYFECLICTATGYIHTRAENNGVWVNNAKEIYCVGLNTTSVKPLTCSAFKMHNAIS